MSRLCHYRADTGGPESASAARRALTNRFDISSAATPPTLGLLAMVTAVARVRGDIRAFGVAPDPVTVAGESAGATCIGGLPGVAVPHGLFARAIRGGPPHPPELRAGERGGGRRRGLVLVATTWPEVERMSGMMKLEVLPA